MEFYCGEWPGAGFVAKVSRFSSIEQDVLAKEHSRLLLEIWFERERC